MILTAVAVLIVSYLLPGVQVDDFFSAFILAIVLALLNSFLKPIFVILTIPFTIITFGLFLLVIDTIIILIAGSFIDGFGVDGFWWALLFSILLSITTSLLTDLSGKNKK
jgi:putative membrane protein